MKGKTKVKLICLTFVVISLLLVPQITQGRKSLVKNSESVIKVAATTTTLADFVGTITNQVIEPIINPGACPAHYDSSPSDLELIQEADVVFCHGFEGQWLDDLLSSAGKTSAKYALAPLVGAVPWGVPDNAKKYLNVITSKLNQTYPELATDFNEELSLFSSQIDAKAIELLQAAQDNNLTGMKAVVMTHQIGFSNFLGLNVVGNWSKSDELMSVQEVSDLAIAAGNLSAELIISNLQSGTSIGKEVASLVNVPHIVLTNFPQDSENSDSYLEMLEYNLQQLVTGLNETKNNGLLLQSTILFLVIIAVALPSLRKKAKK